VGEGSIGSPSHPIRSFQLSQRSLSACWIMASPWPASPPIGRPGHRACLAELLLLSTATRCKRNQAVTTGSQLFRTARERQGGFGVYSLMGRPGARLDLRRANPPPRVHPPNGYSGWV
jgi:hypothetical protein